MKVEYFLQNIPTPGTATWTMHPSTTVALDLVAGPAQGTLLVGKLVAELGRVAGGTSQGSGWKTWSMWWEKGQQGEGSAGIPSPAPQRCEMCLLREQT